MSQPGQIFHIKVFSRHIKDGVKSHCRKCPVALAITEQVLPKFPRGDLYVNVCSVEIFSDGVFVGILPSHVSEFIRKFDHLGTDHNFSFEPFSFDLNLQKY